MALSSEAVSPRRLLLQIASELRVVSVNAFEHVTLGTIGAEPAEASAEEPPRAASFPVASALSAFLYGHYYLGELSPTAAARRSDAATPIVLREHPGFGRELRAANRGAGYADPGWLLIGERSGGLVASKNAISLLVTRDDIVTPPSARVGETVRIRFPNERPYAHPDYYMAIGDGGPTVADQAGPVVRIYFNVRPEGAPALLSTLTRSMGSALDRFCVKILNHPASYPRPDAAVAYVARREFARAYRILDDALPQLASALRPRVPAFTWALAPGVSVAEEPLHDVGPRSSFGQHRCRLVSRGLVTAFAAGHDDPISRYRCLLQQFEAAGVDSRRPYLNAGSPPLCPATEPAHSPALG